jgi:hypothetical protein
MYTIGSAKQLFIDDRFIESARGIQLTLNPPFAHDIVLESQMPWETFRVFFNSIVDTGAGLQMYYTDMCFLADGRITTNLCLAESDDGLHWSRPELGLYEFQDSRKNNIIAPFVHGAPHYDPACPLAPYLMIGTLSGLIDPDGLKPPSEIADPTKHARYKDDLFGITCDKPFLFTSQDGIHWTVAPGPLADFACDNWTNQIFYDHRLKKYVSYLRGFPGRRTVHRYETDDPAKIPWAVPRPDAKPDGYGCVYITNELPIVHDVDPLDRWKGDVQNPAVIPYADAQDVYLAMPSLHRWYPGPGKNPIPADVGARHRFKFFNDGLDDVHLLVSRDGIHWTRPSRWPYIGLGPWGDYNGGSIFTGLGLVRRNNELWHYYTACKRTHGSVVPGDNNSTRICRARQRLDGFVSVDAGPEGAEFTTPLLTFTGNHLELNLNCSALGETRVELLNADNQLIPGHALDDCDPIDLNHIAHIVTWKNNSDLTALQDKPLRLRFKMYLTKLYAFQFNNP